MAPSAVAASPKLRAAASTTGKVAAPPTESSLSAAYIVPVLGADAPQPSQADRDNHAKYADTLEPVPALADLLPASRAAYEAEIARLADVAAKKPPLDYDALGEGYKYKWALPWFDERYKHPLFKDAHLEPFDQYVYRS